MVLLLGLVVVFVGGCGDGEPGGSVNQPPVVSLRDDFTVRLGDLVPVVASASDPDGDVLDFRWELVRVPAEAVPSLDTSGGHIVVLSTDAPGEYELRVEVDDGLAFASDAVVITFDADFELEPWQELLASPYVIPEVVTMEVPDPDSGDLVSTEVAVVAGYVVQGGDLVIARVDEDGGVSTASFIRERAAFPTSVIPYEFVTADFTGSERSRIREALDRIAGKTVLTFEDVTGTGSTDLRIRFERNGLSGRLPGCWAEKNFLVAPGVRVVNLGSAPGHCMAERIIKHEVLHALGFYHEHQRRDRNDYVEVTLTEPLNPNAWGSYLLNFDIPLDGVASESYDWLSIMHYRFGVRDYGIRLEPRARALPADVDAGDVGICALRSDTDGGCVQYLSQGDIEAINALYESESPYELFAYVGTNVGHWDPVPRIASVFFLQGPAPDVDTSVEVIVTGPPAWGVQEFEVTWPRGQSLLQAGRSRSSRGVVSGTYEIRASFNGESVASTVSVDAALVLPLPTGVTLVRSAVDQVELSWDPVSGVAVYTVALDHLDSLSLFFDDRGTDPEFLLSGFDTPLDAGERYRVRVGAASLELAPASLGLAEPPPSQQVNGVSSTAGCFFPGDEEFTACD